VRDSPDTLSRHASLGCAIVNRLDVVAAYVGARWRAATLHGARLHAWQERRARALVTHVRATSPFHAAHWAGAPASQWRQFPTVDKHTMMRAFDDFTTAGISRDDAMRVALEAESTRDFSATVHGCTVGLSSGTSGHRGLFVVSAAEQARWAGTIVARAIPDLRPGHRVAFFLRANSRLYEQTSSVVQFRFFDLMQPLDSMIAALNAFMPRLVVGPPSLLGMLADARLRGTLRARPSRVISVAEVLEPQDRAALAAAFQAPVGEVYQCTEGLVAVTCAHGSLHVQEDIMLVQTDALDPRDPLRVSPILTDLWRRTQPIIRYRLGDVLQLTDAVCPCGSSWQRIAAIEGRQDDLCWFPQRDDALRVVFPDAIRRMVLLADDRITEYRVVQESPGALRIEIDVLAGALFSEVAAKVDASVTAVLHGYECHATAVTIAQGVASAPVGAKRRRVICTWRAARAEAAA
jgi:putative adenylate-forming enzyme